MPKEVISKFEENEDGSRSRSKRAVEVRWNKEIGDVQIVTVDFSWDTERKPPQNPFTGAVTPGWFVDLDRSQINKLIRALRTARDQAYGRDE